MHKIALPLLHHQVRNIALVMYFILLAVNTWETQKRTVMLWNPLVQPQCDLACPYCRSSLRTWRWNDGTSPHSMPRSTFSVQERVLLVSCVYLCGNHQVITHDPNLLKSVCEAGIRIPFILFHKSGMTEELHNFISSSIQAGLCIQEIESMLLNL